jgi:hypothetical protein
MVNETGQPYAYAVDDPVNQTDPTGDGGYGAYFDEQAATANADFCHAHSNYCQFGDPSDSTMLIVAGISLGIIALATGGAGLIAVSEVGVGTLSTTLGTVSLVSGTGAVVIDAQKCRDNPGLNAACVATGLGALSVFMAIPELAVGYGLIAEPEFQELLALNFGGVIIGGVAALIDDFSMVFQNQVHLTGACSHQ